MEKLRKDDAKDNIKKYENQLVLDELSERTIKKYVVDVEQWLNDMPDIINKRVLYHTKTTWQSYINRQQLIPKLFL